MRNKRSFAAKGYGNGKWTLTILWFIKYTKYLLKQFWNIFVIKMLTSRISRSSLSFLMSLLWPPWVPRDCTLFMLTALEWLSPDNTLHTIQLLSYPPPTSSHGPSVSIILPPFPYLNYNFITSLGQNLFHANNNTYWQHTRFSYLLHPLNCPPPPYLQTMLSQPNHNLNLTQP